MSKLLLLFVLAFTLAACGAPTTPCDDSDPVGICANSHHQVPTGS